MPGPPRPQLTHFLCIPLVTSASRSQLRASLSSFRAATTAEPEESSSEISQLPNNSNGGMFFIPEKAIRPLGTLHLTLGVMSLLSQDTLNSCLQLLKSLDLKSILAESMVGNPGEVEREKELRVTLKGLTSMHDPSKTSILYAEPLVGSSHHPKSLEDFCSRLKKLFTDAGYIMPDTRPLLLHATIVNTIYAPGVRKATGEGGGHGKKKAKLTLDATGVLEKFKDMLWFEDCSIEKVAICRMGAVDVRDSEGKQTGDQEYAVEGEVDLF
jgi:activating signal cointegrator complex subunit 1